MEEGNPSCTCDDHVKLGAGDNEINAEPSTVDETDVLIPSDNLNDIVLDDIDEEGESEENTISQQDSTSEECESEEESNEEIEYDADHGDEENSILDESIVLSESKNIIKLNQSNQNKTNVAKIEDINRMTVPERPKEYIFLLGPDSFIKSVLAATTINKIEEHFRRPMKLLRVMPNTPLDVGEGCCVFSPNELVDVGDINLTRTLLESSGLCLEVPESQINAMASISSSGPAFMYTIIEAMADGGVKMGVPRSQAIKLAAQTMLGAAKMVLQSGKHSAQLKDEVCSAGGTTIAGVHALEKGGIRGTIMDAVEATTKRSLEMGQ
ncbi:pyrroline-5-carboxylate reductase 3-like isoform X3 [Coccinella septempunctata]|uniref:pyrroline-5-carboxylate reductase 3-like isoform X3 n=1 Tax=Coccinella septempunctata TaxID=41139 RepID=UPI001D092EA6|nr:pyrroline-5-carboxylate reductase 3-like isoform X3 [Coccinella septempunctata]